jgi:hypothetical protein
MAPVLESFSPAQEFQHVLAADFVQISGGFCLNAIPKNDLRRVCAQPLPFPTQHSDAGPHRPRRASKGENRTGAVVRSRPSADGRLPATPIGLVGRGLCAAILQWAVPDETRVCRAEAARLVVHGPVKNGGGSRRRRRETGPRSYAGGVRMTTSAPCSQWAKATSRTPPRESGRGALDALLLLGGERKR